VVVAGAMENRPTRDLLRSRVSHACRAGSYSTVTEASWPAQTKLQRLIDSEVRRVNFWIIGPDDPIMIYVTKKGAAHR
jgi:hypothetical protein